MLAWLIAALAIVAAIVAVIANRSANSVVVAAWVQAVGSIAAIVIVSLPVLLQHSLEVRRAKAVTIATLETAWSVMQSIADRYLNQESHPSEWWVPQWQIINEALAQCPIQKVGSAEATRSFIHFRELFIRAEAFSEPDDDAPLAGFVGFIMSNASSEISALQNMLK